MLPLLLDSMLCGELQAENLLRLLCSGPAAVWRLVAKGRLQQGYDADIVLVDPATERVLDAASLHSRAGWSAFHGRKLRGRVVRTILRGQNRVSRR